MTNWVDWFRYQLKASGDGLVWAFTQIDRVRQYHLPPDEEYMGLWSPARHVWHVTEYERYVALPSMRQWLNGSKPTDDAWNDDDTAWSAVKDCKPDELIAAFRTVRDEQITFLDQLESIDWTTERETIWEYQPLWKVVTKTYQHTLEHGDTLLRMALWWDYFEKEK
jgi:hypothetical protein